MILLYLELGTFSTDIYCRQILYRLNHQGSLGLNLQILTLQHAVPAVSYLLSLMNKISWYSFPAPLFVYLGSRHRAHTHVLMPFSQIISPPPAIESKRLFYTSVSLLLSCIYMEFRKMVTTTLYTLSFFCNLIFIS